MVNPVEVWKSEKHAFEVWADCEKYAAARTPMKEIPLPDLERLKWYGFFYRKRDGGGRYMNRIRITAGEMTAEQAQEIAHLAYEFGHGIVDVTTRANLQIQGLEIEHLPKVAARLEKVGASSKQTGHDNVRNVFAHPYSGLLPGELIDTRQLCHDVTALFINSREYSDLPRKMNICLNGTEDHSAQFWTQDISFLAACDEEDNVGFHLLVGGMQGPHPQLASPLPVWVTPAQVVDVTRALLDLYRARGSREKRSQARFRFVVDTIGVDGVLQWLEQALPFSLSPCSSQPVRATCHDELVGWFRQSDAQLWTMGLSIPLGRMTWKQLEGLGRLSKKWADGQLRTTHEQGIAIINVPAAHKDAAATDAAALGLSVHADSFDRNTVACTGSQFCNLAVTETKGHMFQLMETLRKRALMLHGIRIHMSGCSSSCAQHHTADIGLKGVRVRRLLGTREGFDVYLGGGISGQVHMGLPYKLGVDVDQLPTLIEDVVNEYYLLHQPAQSFSAYWREKLQTAQADRVGDSDFYPPVWSCESCGHQHVGEDPPLFCPLCAALRRHFVRLDDMSPSDEQVPASAMPPRSDGFSCVADWEQLSAAGSLAVDVQGTELALFDVDGHVVCTDAACPHEGGSLADGTIVDNVVTCPRHQWEFDVCSGCSVSPPGHLVKTYKTLVENGNIFVQTRPPAGVPVDLDLSPISSVKAADVSLKVLDVIAETPDVRTFRLDNSRSALPQDFPGKFVQVRIRHDNRELWRSFTISSSPTDRNHVELTVKLNHEGVVTQHLFDNVKPGSSLRLKGAMGEFYFDPDQHNEPLVLIAAGSGITPMMAIARFLRDTGRKNPCTLLYGARTEADIIFHDQCRHLAADRDSFRYVVFLTQPQQTWNGETGRIDFQRVKQFAPNLSGSRFFLCGPNDFMDDLQSALIDAGVSAECVHTERYHTAPQPAIV